jgi:outer membrane protein TolC
MAQVKQSMGRSGGLAAVLATAAGLFWPAAAGAQQRITAEDAVRMALQSNPTVLQSEQDVRTASGQFLVQRSAILPQLSLGAGYRNTLRQSFGFSRTGIQQSKDFWSGSASIDQNLISFPSWGRIRSASSGREAASQGSRATRADIALNAYTQYYTLLKAYKLAAVRAMALQLQNDQLRRTQALFELGSVARGDVLKQQVQVSQARLDDIAARADIEVERARLAAVLGIKIGTTVDIDTSLTEPSFEVDSAAVLKDALARRPELAQMRARLAAARASLGAAQGGRYPSLGGTLSYNFQTAGVPKTFLDIDRNAGWSAGLALNVPVFDGFSTKGSIRQAKAGKLSAEYALQGQELAIVVEVQQVLQAALQAKEQIEVARDGLSAAQEDLKLTQEKYNVGSATVIELIDSQVAMTTAAANFISSMADAHVAEMQLRRARGESF